jgi:hypothetical protein
VLHFLIAHVTILLVVAFFILFLAQKADGIVSLFGNILGAWVVIIAVLHVVGFFVPGMMGTMHGGMMHEHWAHDWGGKSDTAAPQPAPAAAPAKPAPMQAAPAAPATPKKP